jgi:hypothetical protein
VTELLSRDCDGCPLLRECSQRYQKVKKGEKVYCPDGTVHLIDEASVCQNIDSCSEVGKNSCGDLKC